jgi:D-alanyl-D-alanine dipeptidase
MCLSKAIPFILILIGLQFCGQSRKIITTSKPDYLVNLDSLFYSPEFHREIRYATSNNFLQEKLYKQNPGLWLERSAARALRQVNWELLKYGVQLKIWDAYRPYSVTVILYAKSPKKKYVANPERGSVHNRGSAVDLTLVDLQGKELEMPSDYDAFGIQSVPNYLGGSLRSRQNRDLLINMMQRHGFKVNAAEWWHFEYKNAYQFPLLDCPLGCSTLVD